MLRPASAQVLFFGSSAQHFGNRMQNLSRIGFSPQSKITSKIRNVSCPSPLPNYLVRPRQHIGRNCQADLLRRLEIKNKLKLRGAFHRPPAGLRALAPALLREFEK
jgi:hypothetical protein